MHEHGTGKAFEHQDLGRIVLLGNPNVGKSVIFSLLTGKYVTVSNYPGTTIEVSHGIATLGGRKYLIIDTPGINSLTPMSEDERVTRDILLRDEPQGIIHVADAKNLRRALLITLQLAEMRLPIIFVLNMYDEARSRGMMIDKKKLSELLGVGVIESVATRRKGIKSISREVLKAEVPKLTVKYDKAIENGIKRIIPLLPQGRISKPSMALMLLAGDRSLVKLLRSEIPKDKISRIEEAIREVQSQYSESLGYVINQQRLHRIDEFLGEIVAQEKTEKRSHLETFGELSTHPVAGIPILLVVLVLMYLFVGYLGAQILVDYFENVLFGEYLTPFVVDAFALLPSEIIRELFVGEYGLITMALTYAIAIILPIVGTFFIAFGVLEDSGYLPRLAIMVNKLFNRMGLNGKAVLPMVLGLGCDTMATLTTRILETKKERIIVTLLLALGVPCSAQLGVILGVLAGLSIKGTLIWIGVILGVLFSVGYLASKVIPGKGSDFILELPPIRIPQAGNIAVKTLARIEWYLREAVPLFLLGTLVLFTMDKLGVLAVIEAFASPIVVGFLGLPVKATEAFLIGFLRRDYGAAGLFALAAAGQMDATQIVVSLVTITLFVPCIANFFIIIKERGFRTAMAIVAFIFPFAFLVGGALNFILRTLEVAL